MKKLLVFGVFVVFSALVGCFKEVEDRIDKVEGKYLGTYYMENDTISDVIATVYKFGSDQMSINISNSNGESYHSTGPLEVYEETKMDSYGNEYNSFQLVLRNDTIGSINLKEYILKIRPMLNKSFSGKKI